MQRQDAVTALEIYRKATAQVTYFRFLRMFIHPCFPVIAVYFLLVCGVWYFYLFFAN